MNKISIFSWFCSLLVALLLVSVGSSGSAVAQATNDHVWRFAIVVGDVRARPLFGSSRHDWQSVINGDRVGAGSRIETGDSSHALITNGRDSLTLDANTMLTLPAIGENGIVVIRQRSGTVSYDVGTRSRQSSSNFFTGDQPRQEFQIRTPFLATLVKGTRFVVTVGENEEIFEVSEGVVGITDFATARVTDIIPRQIATKTAGTALDVDVVRRRRLIRDEVLGVRVEADIRLPQDY